MAKGGKQDDDETTLWVKYWNTRLPLDLHLCSYSNTNVAYIEGMECLVKLR